MTMKIEIAMISSKVDANSRSPEKTRDHKGQRFFRRHKVKWRLPSAHPRRDVARSHRMLQPVDDTRELIDGLALCITDEGSPITELDLPVEGQILDRRKGVEAHDKGS